MSRIRMVSGMAAAGVDASRGPALALCRGGRIVLCAVFSALWFVAKTVFGALWFVAKAGGRTAKVIIPWLVLTVVIAILAYLGYLAVGHFREQAAIAAEATKQETAFSESAEAANESAEDLEINSRVRVLVASRLGESGESTPDTGELSSLEGMPDGRMTYRALTTHIVPDPEVVKAHGMLYDGDHTVRLMAMRSAATGQDYISVEVDGVQAYLCVTLRDEYGEPADSLWPWVYKGVGMWEHLLDEAETMVAKDRQQQEIDSRFGNLEEEK